MNDPWLPLLKSLPLSRTEQEVIKRYSGDPMGRTFLPVADILRSHRLIDEALEILMQGVERHPGFTVARVVLARELFQKGMMANAWRILEESPVSLRENVLAQKLRFKLAVLLNYDAVARTTFQHLQLHQMLDVDTKRIGDMLEVNGLAPSRERLIRDLRERGTEAILPVEPVKAAVTKQVVTEITNRPLEDRARSYDIENDDFEIEGEDTMASFHVVPLDEIFQSGDLGKERGPEGAGIELDSTTLAEIYAKQGYHAKALSVYHRLLKLAPGNDLLRRKVAEVTKLERQETERNQPIDPTAVERMETLEILDRQIRFYSDLLTRIGG
jgi:hypothetical protein